MGDNWEHDVLVEAIEEGAAEPLPHCLTGRRAAPPEDCGGFPGYYELVAMIEKKKRLPDHLEELKDYDPAHFDQEAVNEALANIDGYIRRIETDVYGA